MDLTVTPDTYTPSIDNFGNYIDHIPPIKNGLFCPCGSRKEKAYDTISKFSSHVKTKAHQKWLLMLNQNRANHFVEMLDLRELVENQKRIIGQLETQVMQKGQRIDYLIDQMKCEKVSGNTDSVDLLGLN